MTLETAAELAADLFAGRFTAVPGLTVRPDAALVDVSHVHDAVLAADRTAWQFLDQPVELPWEQAILLHHQDTRPHSAVANVVEWTDDVPDDIRRPGHRYLAGVLFNHNERGTAGMFRWVYRVTADGMFDAVAWYLIHSLKPDDPEEFRRAMGINQAMTMAALNFLSFTNIAVEEPARPRGQVKRLRRILPEHRIETLVVYPPGKRRGPSIGPSVFQPGLALHGVRGHPAYYGPKYGKGLLFGKYEGRFWIPPHFKGDPELGTVDKSYELRP